MQIKQRGSTVQLLRATYLPEQKRSIQISLGTFDTHCRSVQDISEGILATLTPAEQEQLAAWFDSRELQRRIARRPYAGPAMNRIITTVAAMTEIATEVLLDIEIRETDLDRLITAWRKFARTLERRGFSLPVKFPPKSLAEQVLQAVDEPPHHPNRSDEVIEAVRGLTKTQEGKGRL